MMNVNPMRQYQEYGELDTTTEMPGFGACLWNVEARKQFKAVPDFKATTIVEMLEHARTHFASRRCAGRRELIKVHMVDEGGAQREKIQYANEFTWLSYDEYYKKVLNVARGLNGLGVEPKSKVVIYAETQLDWMVAAFAAFFSNSQVVTIYATLGEQGAIHGINETEAQTVIADAKLLKILTKILPKCKSVKTVVTMTPAEPALADKIKAENVKLSSLDEVVESGKTNMFSPQLPKPEDIAVIMYTSGTTGPPKGVVISHANMMAVVAGTEHALKGMVAPEDVYLAYLPLAHIMEMIAEICFMAAGTSIGYGTPHTLTDTGVKLKRPESMGDAPCLQPTIMVFAPAVLDKIYQAVQGKRSQLGGLGQKFFQWGLNSGSRHFNRGLIGANRLLNGLIFKKVQKLVGGRLKAVITGSAPLSPEIQVFCQTVLRVPIRQGYGLTETCAGSCVGFWGDNAMSSVGPPTVCTVIRLADWAEGNYMNSDKDKPEICLRRGEVLIGGPSVSQGYYINESKPNEELQKKNKEDWVVIAGIRYFRTGDVGQINPNGTLQIIDRKKDLWKGPQGEYVALTKVEAALKLCDYVDLPMVYGKTGGEYPVALICPQPKRILELGANLDLKDLSLDVLCKDERIVKTVADACKAKCKEQKLVEFEIPKKLALISDAWTPENDMLTAALKMKRPMIAAKHKADIDALYSS